MTLILRIDTVGKRFGGRPVLNAASLRAFAGGITYLVGINGCGKSTLLRIAVGLVTADSGTVTYGGRTTYRPRWHRMARAGLFLLPDRELLAPDRRVRQHLESVTRQFRIRGFDDAAAVLDLQQLLDHRSASLSTGERRRVEVAVALARRPTCLLADEPFRNIDPADRLLVARALRHLAAAGCAVVVTGHEVEDLLPTVDAVTWCTDGTTYELGPPGTALRHAEFVRRYVGPARAARLFDATEISGVPAT